MSMTENEAIKVLEKPSKHIRMVHKTKNEMEFYTYSADLVEAFEKAISALEEVQELHAIGTVSEFRELKKKATAKESYGIKCPHCNFYTSNGRYCCNCGKMLVAKSEGKE